ncbi:S1 family peptidase [Streptomyces spectabilis]|uniref:Serine protease n=1 Tax=Streptomyces spectabilis TaxID=68270 RepID=A0A5P2XLQ7_STRST|nr:serine protease [Streptomyces spectabilis]MBB5102279.1 V8-like Glu-specific endopeptidase [Streptomyces spectabilis]MCI3907327.1 serine protease [Streptomyces spectabilis]QEV64055.1 serine protease [Streptomyces spectabilis]GGV29856.1 serine protease [Streptomyces spectabilis]
MNKPLVGAVFTTLLLGATAIPAAAITNEAPTADKRTTATKPVAATKAKVNAKAVTYAGTVALSNCSGSVVRVPNSQPTDKALVLSNGHCLETGFPGPGQVIVNRASTRSFTLLNASGGNAGTVRASKIAYGTMTDTDVSLYELTSTYRDIETRYGIKALDLDAAHPQAGRAITVASGYWKRMYKCNIDGFAYRLKEGRWTWKDSVRYTQPCQVIGGTSGSPVIDDQTGKVVAVNNTINESGQRCTDNNPCEVDENGNVTVRNSIGYAQQTYIVVPCVGAGNKIDLNRPGCTLPKPAAAAKHRTPAGRN